MPKTLKQKIEAHKYLRIDEEIEGEEWYGVFDRREQLAVAIESEESLKYLVQHGARAHLESPYNGIFH